MAITSSVLFVYWDSTVVIRQINLFCARYVRSIGHEESNEMLTAYRITYGIRNPSSTNVAAVWFLSTYTAASPQETFTIPAQGSAYPSFNITLEMVNATLAPSDVAIHMAYTVFFFTFQENSTAVSLPACP